MAFRKIFLTGQRFSRLLVLDEAASLRTDRCWKCLCDCGTVCIVRQQPLRLGMTRSCGCLQSELARFRSTKHGESYHAGRGLTVEYSTWLSMKARCTNPRVIRWDRYGGRGIRVCASWANSYLNFLADMGRKPSPAHSIERIDNDGNYEPGNCKWATVDEQQQNKTQTLKVTPAVKKELDSLLAQGLSQSAVAKRLGLGTATVSNHCAGRNRKMHDPENIAKIKRLLAAGKLLRKDVAFFCGVSLPYLRRVAGKVR